MLLAKFPRQLLVLAIGASVNVLARPANTDGCQALDDPVSSCLQPSANTTNYLKFAVLGDSWASGVAYSSGTQYDDNSDSCLRSTEAYAVQMKDNLEWANGNQYLEFSACSGAVLQDIVLGGCQMCQLDDPNIIIMTVGGNDANFAQVAINCIYQPDQATDYGPDYADDTNRTGACADAINISKNYIQDPKKGLAFDLNVTFSNMLDTNLVKNNPDIRIYQTGYAHFFNVDEEWCNGESFGAIPGIIPGAHKPKLSQQLRTDINDLVQQVNMVIQQVTGTFAENNFGFIDISPGFNGHRFCESGGTHLSQYYSDDVWFWNLSYPWFGATNTTNSTDVTLDGPLFGGNVTTDSGSGNGNVAQGWEFRPFHPKLSGHTAIMNATIAKLRADNVPGVSPS